MPSLCTWYWFFSSAASGTRGVRLSPGGGVCRSHWQSLSACGDSQCMSCSCGRRAACWDTGSLLCCHFCTEAHLDMTYWNMNGRLQLLAPRRIYKPLTHFEYVLKHTHEQDTYKDTRCWCLWTPGADMSADNFIDRLPQDHNVYSLWSWQCWNELFEVFVRWVLINLRLT